MLPTPNYKYSYQWAQGIVEQFVEKQARGTYNLRMIAGMSHSQLCKHLIHLVRQDNQVEWRALKLMIKQARSDNWREFQSTSIEMRRKYLTLVKYNCQDLAMDEISVEKGIDKPRQQSLVFESTVIPGGI